MQMISYLRVNLAKVLIGFDSKNEDFRLSRLLISLLPSNKLDKKDERQFKLALIKVPTKKLRYSGGPTYRTLRVYYANDILPSS